jgi:hypothetical protein
MAQYLHQHISGSRFELLDGADDLPSPGSPHQVIAAIHRFLNGPPVISARR